MARRANYTKSDFLSDANVTFIEDSLTRLGKAITEQLLAACPLSAEDWLALAWAPEEREGARTVSRARRTELESGYVGAVHFPLVIDPGPEWRVPRASGVASLGNVRYRDTAGEYFLFPNLYDVSVPSRWADRCEVAASASDRLTAWASEFANHHVRLSAAFEVLTRLLRDCASLQEMRNWLPQITILLRMAAHTGCEPLADKVAAFKPIDHRCNPSPAMRQQFIAVAGWIAGASMLYEAVKTTPTQPAPGQGLVEARYAAFDARAAEARAAEAA